MRRPALFTLRRHDTGAELDTVTSLNTAATRARPLARAGIPVLVEQAGKPVRLYRPEHAHAAPGGYPYQVPCPSPDCGGWMFPRAAGCRKCWAATLKPVPENR